MKPYLLFAGLRYYPSGGWRDYMDEFDSIEGVMEYIADMDLDWWHIVSTETKSIVESGRSNTYT